VLSDFEIILVNDGSLDGSDKICNSYADKEERVRVYHQENSGVSSARNTGLKNALGRYICFIDADDALLTSSIEGLIPILRSGDVDILYLSKYLTVSSDGSQHIVSDSDICEINKDLYINYLLSGSTATAAAVWGKFFKRSLLINSKFDESISIGEDIIFQLDILLKSSNIVIEIYREAIYEYTVLETSAMRTAKGDYFLILISTIRKLLLDFNVLLRYEGQYCHFYLVNLYLFISTRNRGLDKEEYRNQKAQLVRSMHFIRVFPFRYKVLLFTFLYSRELGNMLIKMKKFLRNS
jgi:glycosyltransferase involved in cell wall biosynthesis